MNKFIAAEDSWWYDQEWVYARRKELIKGCIEIQVYHEFYEFGGSKAMYIPFICNKQIIIIYNE